MALCNEKDAVDYESAAFDCLMSIKIWLAWGESIPVSGVNGTLSWLANPLPPTFELSIAIRKISLRIPIEC